MDARLILWTPRMLPAVMVWLFSGCGEPGPTALADDARPALSRVSAEMHGQPASGSPFRLHATARILAQELAPGFGPPAFGTSDFDGRCSGPADFVIRFGLEGEATHLGRFNGTVEHCTQIDFSTGEIAIIDGAMLLTAADGDELRAGYTGGSGAAGTEEVFSFTGGTGRFASASGGGIGRPECDQAAGICTFSLDGSLDFDARDRR